MQVDLENAEYVLLATLRKNGNMVETPVWFAEHDGGYYMFSEGKAGKVKRLRNFKTAALTPCNVVGKPLGVRVDAEAELLTAKSDIAIAYQALVSKYGWKMRALDLLSTLGRKINKRQFIRATLV